MLSFIWRPFQVKHLRDFRLLTSPRGAITRAQLKLKIGAVPAVSPGTLPNTRQSRTRWRLTELCEELNASVFSVKKWWPSASHPERAPFLHQLWVWRYRLSSAWMRNFLHISWTFSAEVSCSYFISATKVVTWVIFHRTLLRVGRRLSSPAPSYLRPLYHRLSAVSPDVSPPSAFQTQPISTAALCDQIPCLSQTTS